MRTRPPFVVSSPFPAWDQGPYPPISPRHRATWVIPMTGKNTQLQFGQFKDLKPGSFTHPPPEQNLVGAGRRIRWGTPDGRVSCEVRVDDRWVRCNAYSRMQSGAKVSFGMDVRYLEGPLADARRKTACGSFVVNSVRNASLSELSTEPDGAPWMNPAEPQVDASARLMLADLIWDATIHLMRHRQLRHLTVCNPQCWVYELWEAEQA